jgi:hypothetical protein
MSKNSMEYYAKLASLSYKKGADKRNLLRSTFRDLQIVKENSRDGFQVLINPRTGKIFVSIRGTDLSTIKSAIEDLGTDLALSIGQLKHTPRFRRDDRELQKLIAKYGKDNITITGHSLGGKLAVDLARKYDIEAHAFNEGASPLEAMEEFGGESSIISDLKSKKKQKDHSNINRYFVSNDPVSISGLVGNSTGAHDTENLNVIAQSGSNAHSLDNFTGTPDFAIQ